MVEELKRRGYRTIGWVGSGAMPHRFVARVERELDGKVQFVDATEFIDALKAIKSEEEKALIRRAAQMQDEVFKRVLRENPPRHDATTTSRRWRNTKAACSAASRVSFSARRRRSGRHRVFSTAISRRAGSHPGEHFTLLIENNGPGGFYTEIARTMVLGKASNELIDGFESMKEAQAHTLQLLKPGASCAEIARRHDEHMRSRGLPPELRLYAHGQGYDLVERPLIRADETMTIEKNMNLAVHPGYETPSIFAVICDNYLIEAGRAGRVPAQDAEAGLRAVTRA